MHIVALAKTLSDLESAASALAQACKLAPAEARMRLQAGPPYLAARVSPEEVSSVVSSLQQAGLAAYEVIEPLPSDAERTQARELAFGDTALRVQPRSGLAVEIPYAEIALLLVGTRVARSSSSKTTTTTKVAIGAAIVTGGLKLTKTETKTERTEAEVAIQELLVFGRGGLCAAIREDGVVFDCLGSQIQPSRMANFQLVVRTLRAKAPQARFDDRLLRLGRRTPIVTVPAVGGGATDGFDTWAALIERAAALGLL